MDKPTPQTHPPEGYVPDNKPITDADRIAMYQRDRKRDQQRIAELEKFHKAVRNAYYAPPMEAAPITDHDYRMVSRAVCQALAALEEGEQDG